MNTDYARHYRELFERHWWWRARQRFIMRVLRAHRPANGWPHILDVGCGDGLFFEQLREFGDVEGVEPDPAALSEDGAQRGRIAVMPFEAFKPERRFDLIVMLDVLEHFADQRAAMEHALSLLNENGMMLITVPAFEALWTKHDELNHHYVRFTRRSFAALSQQVAFRPVWQRYFFTWLFPVKAAVRLKEWVLSSRPRTPGIPPAPINAGLYGISVLEQETVGRMGLPFGSSLLILGRAA